MPLIDFKEIAKANNADGSQDNFELFARDFLDFMGYKIVSDPNRGADGGADIIVEETRTGVGGSTTVRWLVSCKHKAHSGSSVSGTDEQDIIGRTDAHGCQGFIGFYSTLASSGLAGTIDKLRGRIYVQLFDKEKIEKNLLRSSDGLSIVERYFPQSFSSFKKENKQAVKIFSDSTGLKCDMCHKDLFSQDDPGIIQLWKRFDNNYDTKHYEHVFWVCRGDCDDRMSASIRLDNQNLIDGWEDISDVMIPTIYIKWVMTIMNELRSGTTYSEAAFKKLKTFMLELFPYVSREFTSKENDRVRRLLNIPSYIGGLKYDD